jgi:hypothetical protein
MSADDEFRRNADECFRMADATRNERDKAAWLRIAEKWLRMIRGGENSNRSETASRHGHDRPGRSSSIN